MANATKSRLRDWKEIAAFFDRDERTVRRWERQRGLPVHRISGGARNLVYAYPEELEAWLRGSNLPAAPHAATTAPENVAPATLAISAARPRRWRMAAFLAAVSLAAIIGARYWIDARSEYVPNDAARTFYLDGVYNLDTRQPAALERAIDLLTRATESDPGFAQAYARLSEAYAVVSQYTTRPPGESYPRAIEAAENALHLDPDNAEALAALAYSRSNWLRDTQGALSLFERAVRADPDIALIHHWYALTLMTTGDIDRALAHVSRAYALNPQSRPIRANRGLVLYYSGKTADALAILEQLRQTDPNLRSPREYLATIYLAEHRNADFVRELKAAAMAGGSPARQAIAEAADVGLAQGGQTGMLESMLAEQKRQFEAGSEVAFKVAGTAAMLGRREDSLKWLQIAIDRREPETRGIWVEPPFRALREDGRYLALVERAGIHKTVKLSG